MGIFPFAPPPTDEDGEDEDPHEPEEAHEDHLDGPVPARLGVDADADGGLEADVEAPGVGAAVAVEHVGGGVDPLVGREGVVGAGVHVDKVHHDVHRAGQPAFFGI